MGGSILVKRKTKILVKINLKERKIMITREIIQKYDRISRKQSEEKIHNIINNHLRYILFHCS